MLEGRFRSVWAPGPVADAGQYGQVENAIASSSDVEQEVQRRCSFELAVVGSCELMMRETARASREGQENAPGRFMLEIPVQTYSEYVSRDLLAERAVQIVSRSLVPCVHMRG